MQADPDTYADTFEIPLERLFFEQRDTGVP
jgi:hypothetical protein